MRTVPNPVGVPGTEALSGGIELQPLIEAGAMDEARLALYDQGYSAGWDDAMAAQTDDQFRIRADLARHLMTKALAVFGDAALAEEWLRSANPALAGNIPIRMAFADPVGREEVEAVLGRIAHGVFG
jgi:hypothetical protein